MRSKAVAAFVGTLASRLSLLGVAFTLFILAGCGSTGGSIGGGGTTTTVTSVTISPTTATVSAGGNASFTATVQGQNNPSQVVTWSVSPATAGTMTAGGSFTSSSAITATTTATITAASTVPGYTNVAGSAAVTINPVPSAVASVSLACMPTSITDIQTMNCTPTVTGTGAFTNTVNLSVTPASAGTLSASSGVSSGSAVTFTPAFAGTATPMITAVSTADSTKSGTVQVTVTLRTITINSATGNIWLPDCAGIVLYNTAQTGMVNGDTIHDDPYPSAMYTVTPPSTLPISMGIGNDPGVPGACSPGAYDEYVTGTDGARSNDHYIPILSPWNMWAGNNTVDEFQADFGTNTTWKYNVADGSADGSLPVAGLLNMVDGNNFITGNLGNGSLLVYNITTGAITSGVNDSGGNFVGAAAKNGIVGYTTTSPSLSFSMEQLNSPNLATLQNVGTAPAAIAMSTGCNTNPNAASAFSYDQAGFTLYRSDAVGNTSNYTVTASLVNQVTLSGFSPASELPKNLVRYVVAWDSTCKAAVLAPVLTGGTNPDGSKAYVMELALVDMTAGTMRQLGTYVSTGIPSTAIRMAADPSGNDVVIASTDETKGVTTLTKISWTLDASENPTFTVTTLGSAPPTGVYGVSLGILPNGKISVGQRQQHYVLANQ